MTDCYGDTERWTVSHKPHPRFPWVVKHYLPKVGCITGGSIFPTWKMAMEYANWCAEPQRAANCRAAAGGNSADLRAILTYYLEAQAKSAG